MLLIIFEIEGFYDDGSASANMNMNMSMNMQGVNGQQANQQQQQQQQQQMMPPYNPYAMWDWSSMYMYNAYMMESYRK